MTYTYNKKKHGDNKAVFLLLLFLSFGEASAGEKQPNFRQIQDESAKQVGLPNIVNFQERRFAKQILESRDKPVKTFTYIVNREGGMHFLCESVGYGLPYSVQYSAQAQSNQVLQGDINGLYMPENTDANWVLCKDDNGGVNPAYVEPDIIVMPFEVKKAFR